MSYLAGDVRPVVLAAKLLEVFLEKSTHFDDTVGHALDLTEPLLVESGVVHDSRGNTGAVHRGVGVEGTDKDLNLRVHALLLFGRLANERESTNTLTVETLPVTLASDHRKQKTFGSYHVLSETLAQGNVVALLDEVPGSKGITVSITTGKALVGHVEESKVALLLHDVRNLAPLVLSRVDTGGVVGASMEQNDAVVGGSLKVGNQALEVEANGVLVVVTVLLNFQARVLEDGVVVGPARGGEIDLLRARVETLEESTTNSQSTSTGDGLGDNETVILQDGGVGAVGQLSGSLSERRDTSDSSIFLIEARCNNLVLGGANGWQNERLALVVAYCGQKYG